MFAFILQWELGNVEESAVKKQTRGSFSHIDTKISDFSDFSDFRIHQIPDKL